MPPAGSSVTVSGFHLLTIAEEFDNNNLTVMSVSAQSEQPIHEFFVRLNRSKSLTGAEIRNAMAGPAPNDACWKIV